MRRTIILSAAVGPFDTDAGFAGRLYQRYGTDRKFLSAPNAKEPNVLNQRLRNLLEDVSAAERQGVAGLMTYTVAVSALCRLHRPRHAEVVWGRMEARGFVPPLSAHISFLSYYAKQRDLLGFYARWERLLKSGLPWPTCSQVYTVLFSAFARTGQSRAAVEAVLHTAQRHLSVPVPRNVFLSYLHALPRVDEAALMPVVRQYCEESGVPLHDCCAALLKPCVRSKQTEAAERLFNLLPDAARSRQAWSLLLQAQESYPAMRAVLSRMRAANVRPLPGALVAVVDTAPGVAEAEDFFGFACVYYPEAVNVLVQEALLRRYMAADKKDRASALFHRFPGLENCKTGRAALREL